MFIQVKNPATGQMTWKVADENYDLAQEIARSRYADMLHDHERNKMYEIALHNVISELQEQGKNVHVVDIGTGTGLLSMMAVRAGANQVTAIEMFKPMADCARKIFERNSVADKIHLISSRSTDLDEIDKKGNVLVAEVFDTELIGEGALRTFERAHKTLLEKNSRVIPTSARIWAVPVNSEFLKKFNQLPGSSFKSPYVDCPGLAAVFDIQLSQVPADEIKFICSPFVAMKFDFERPESYSFEEVFTHEINVDISEDLEIHAILTWWDLDMDGTGQHILTMAPKWFNPLAKWRDHWMQGIYYLPQSIIVSNGQKIEISCCHDEFSLWFRIGNGTTRDGPHFCSCKFHSICSRNTVYRLNELESDYIFSEFLRQNYSHKSVLCINDGSLIGLMCAKFAEKVQVFDTNSIFRSAISHYCVCNGINNVKVVHEANVDITEVDSILSEPYFISSILPWDNLRIWFIVQTLLRHSCKEVEIFPQIGILNAMPVEFENLWKTVAAVGKVEGFDLTPFDNICQKARCATDPIVEPQPLWEYPSVCTGDAVSIAKFDITSPVPLNDVTYSALLRLSRKGTNAVVFWMDWKSESYSMNGIYKTCVTDQKPSWPASQKQGVYFIPDEKRNSQDFDKILIEITFSPYDGNISFDFIF